jgi:hypothetical protein
MATLEPETGLVIRYRYLWQRQALAGEGTGRIDRLHAEGLKSYPGRCQPPDEPATGSE